MSSDADSHRVMYDRLLFNRKLLIWVHLLLGGLSAFSYLFHIDLSHFPYWRRGATFGVLMICVPAIFPYLISGVYSWRVVTHRRLGVWVFLSVLVVGAIFVNLLFAGSLGVDVHQVGVFQTAALQTGLYVLAAEFLLHIV